MTRESYFSGVLQTQAYRVLQYYVSTEIKKFGLNPTQWFTLGYIKESKEARAADIAGMLKVEPPLITNLTDDLVKQGLIQKVAGRKDKRVKLLCLTEKGKALVPKIEQKIQAELRRLLDGLDEADLLAYERVLQAIVYNGGLDI